MLDGTDYMAAGAHRWCMSHGRWYVKLCSARPALSSSSFSRWHSLHVSCCSKTLALCVEVWELELYIFPSAGG